MVISRFPFVVMVVGGLTSIVCIDDDNQGYFMKTKSPCGRNLTSNIVPPAEYVSTWKDNHDDQWSGWSKVQDYRDGQGDRYDRGVQNDRDDQALVQGDQNDRDDQGDQWPEAKACWPPVDCWEYWESVRLAISKHLPAENQLWTLKIMINFSSCSSLIGSNFTNRRISPVIPLSVPN